MAKKTANTVNVKADDIYAYLGPTIKGVIQEGTIYRGERAEVLRALETATASYPAIKRLIIKSTEIMTVKQKIKAGGNQYSNAYKELLV